MLRSVHLCGHEVATHRHVCAFVRSADEEYAILAPFTLEGLQNGERVVQIVDPANVRAHDKRMAKAGVDAETAKSTEQLAQMTWHDAYLAEGHFDVDRMLTIIRSAIHDRENRGYDRMRAMGNMGWALKGAPGSEALLEYEARVNLVTANHPDVFVCVYDIEKFPASTVVDVMRTHPAVIIGGVYHENPFFVAAEIMLEELARRGKAKGQ